MKTSGGDIGHIGITRGKEGTRLPSFCESQTLCGRGGGTGARKRTLRYRWRLECKTLCVFGHFEFGNHVGWLGSQVENVPHDHHAVIPSCRNVMASARQWLRIQTLLRMPRIEAACMVTVGLLQHSIIQCIKTRAVDTSVSLRR